MGKRAGKDAKGRDIPRIYFEALDLIVSSIDERFHQPSFKAYANMESLLIGVLNSQDVSLQNGLHERKLC